MRLRGTNWHQEVIYRSVGIEGKAKASHRAVFCVVGHLLWCPVHAGLLWRVPGLGTPCGYFSYLEEKWDALCFLIRSVLSFLIL